MPTVTEPKAPWWGRSVDGASVALFERLLGLVLLVAVVRFFAHDWIQQLYVTPKLHFHYYGFGFIEPWPEPWLSLWFAALGLVGLLLFFGFTARVVVALALLGFGYVELLDVTTYLNHYYFLTGALLLFLLLPRPRMGQPYPWPALLAFRVYVGLVYFYAGVAKLEPEWLLRGEPLASWLLARRELGPLGHLAETPGVAIAMAWAGMLYDLTIPLWLSFRRTRPWAFLVVLAFHGITGWLFPIGVFPWVMTGAATLFFDPAWPYRLVRRRAPTETPARAPSLSLGPLPAAAVGLFLLVQAVVPLRHLLYPGPVTWTEEGFRFSWRVMLVEKHGIVRYRVTDADGRTSEVDPSRYLTPLQEQQMGSQPDLIWQLAQVIAWESEAAGRGRPQVKVDAWVSLNGRPATRLIDPAVDLARVKDDLSPKPWILPGPPVGLSVPSSAAPRSVRSTPAGSGSRPGNPAS